MKRPPKMRTPDHTQLNLDQDKYYCPFIDGYIKILQTELKQAKHIGHNYSYMTYTCGNPMIGETPIGILSGFYGIIVNGPDTIFMLHRISYLSGWVENWFVNVRCFAMMKSAGEWSWKVCLGSILEDQEEGIWGWFSLLFSHICQRRACVCCVCKYKTET